MSRRQIKKLEVMVADVVEETHDTTTVILFTGNDHLEYRPGHFLTLDPHDFPALERFTAYLEDVKQRREPPRAYSLFSSPHEKYLAITVKEERYVSGQTRFPPLLSPLLVRRLPRGTRMVVTGFTGPYVLPDDIEARTDHVVHICAGSGSVPNLSILKHALHHDLKVRHTFIYSNKTWRDVIYRRPLEELARAYPERLRVVHALTREPDASQSNGVGVWRGRVDTTLLRETIEDPSSVEVFVCGPAVSRWEKKAAKERGETPTPRFFESVMTSLEGLGVDRHRIHCESYG